jgi:hypothetical protein
MIRTFLWVVTIIGGLLGTLTVVDVVSLATSRPQRAAIAESAVDAESDEELWRVRKGRCEIRCTMRTVSVRAGAWDQWRAIELRVEHNNAVYLQETDDQPTRVLNRSRKLRASLEAEGWS